MFRSIFIGLLVVAVLGCQARPESTSTVSERALWTIPPSDANFEEWEAPSTLLGLAFMGDVANAEHQRRVLYYENDEKTALEVKLMPLPGGWDSMPAERAISGHFIYQQQHYAARAERHQAHIQWQEEKQAKIIGLPATALYANYQTQEADGIWQHTLWVTLLEPALVTFHLRYPQNDDYSAATLTEALQNFANSNQQHWQP